MQPDDLTKKYKRLFKRRQKQVEKLGAEAEEQFERNFLKRFYRLRPVWRFVAGWLALALLLIACVTAQTLALGGYYKSLQPAAGGIYSEGIVDSYSNANPLYANGQANGAVARLIFASLFKYDEKNQLTGDLAESWQADPSGTRYTVKLKPDLAWHDGQPLTAADVAFTYKTIQNPDVQSPLNSSWQGVKVTATDSRTVVFALPNPLSSFPYSLTTGIIPQHILKDVQPANLRSAQFNTVKPVGSGPYRFDKIEVSGNTPSERQVEIALVPFERYHGGAPKISSFIIRTFNDEEGMYNAFRDKQIMAMVNVQNLPQDVRDDSSVEQMTMPMTAANMVFFKMTQGVLADKAVRQALVAAADIDALTVGLPEPMLPVRGPLLMGSPGFDPKYQQQYEGSEKASEILEAAGWTRMSHSRRSKGGVPLAFKLYAQKGAENERVLAELRRQWQEIGAEPEIILQDANDLSTTVAGIGGDGGHSYDALLYGISLGVDPDEYAYWHSKQADIRSSRLNFSEYKNPIADAALEAGRTRSDPQLRAVKYQPFLQAWKDDAPALGLYQPHFAYVTRGHVYGLNERTLTQGTDRFNTVESWMIRRVPQPIEK